MAVATEKRILLSQLWPSRNLLRKKMNTAVAGAKPMIGMRYRYPIKAAIPQRIRLGVLLSTKKDTALNFLAFPVAKLWKVKTAESPRRRIEASSGKNPPPGFCNVPIGYDSDVKHTAAPMTKMTIPLMRSDFMTQNSTDRIFQPLLPLRSVKIKVVSM